LLIDKCADIKLVLEALQLSAAQAVAHPRAAGLLRCLMVNRLVTAPLSPTLQVGRIGVGVWQQQGHCRWVRFAAGHCRESPLQHCSIPFQPVVVVNNSNGHVSTAAGVNGALCCSFAHHQGHLGNLLLTSAHPAACPPFRRGSWSSDA
jgi:hypothetical protein